VVGKDGIAVVVHPDNKIVTMTKDQVKQVYAGNIEHWEDIW
jgi:phosphate transport system substrate-binding protein